jgi:hypothetical protein
MAGRRAARGGEQRVHQERHDDCGLPQRSRADSKAGAAAVRRILGDAAEIAWNLTGVHVLEVVEQI